LRAGARAPALAPLRPGGGGGPETTPAEPRAPRRTDPRGAGGALLFRPPAFEGQGPGQGPPPGALTTRGGAGGWAPPPSPSPPPWPAPTDWGKPTSRRVSL